MRTLAVIALVAACGGVGIDPARFAPRPAWTPGAYAIVGAAPAIDPATRLSSDQLIEDVAYLELILDKAWAAGPAEMSYDVSYVRERIRRLAERPSTIADFCEGLVGALHNTPLRVAVGGERCNTTSLVVTPPTPPLRAPEPGRNYAWHVEGEGEDTPIGVLTITRFVDPADPGWQGIDGVLRQLATVDLVLIDLQAATGDDPRVGFAILAALGFDREVRVHPPMFRDGPYAEVARGNRGASTARSRQLWSAFGTANEIERIARSISPVSRPAPERVVVASVVVGSQCERACQLIAALADRNERHVVMAGWVAAQIGFDEYGLVRLPHSTIEVALPTAWYGVATGVVGRLHAETRTPAEQLAQLTAIATVNPDAVAWRRRPVLDCATLAPDPSPSVGGCTQLPADPASVVSVFVKVGIDEDVARRFFATCPGLTLGTVLGDPIKRTTLVTLTAPAGTLARVASAPFVTRIETGCRMYPD
jgi:hypothetical protein